MYVIVFEKISGKAASDQPKVLQLLYFDKATADKDCALYNESAWYKYKVYKLTESK